MEAVTLTLEDKQQGGDPNANPEGAPREPVQGSGDAAARSKDGKPAAERKRTRSLSEDKRFKLFSGTANRPLAEEIGLHIGVKVGEAKLQRFADGEVSFHLLKKWGAVAVF